MLQPAKSKSARSLQTILEFTAERTLNPLSWTHRFKTHALGSDRIGSYQASPASGDMRVLSCNVQSSAGRQEKEREKPTIKRSDTKKKPKGGRKRQNTEERQICKWMDGASGDVEEREWGQIEIRRDRRRERENKGTLMENPAKSNCWYWHLKSDWPPATCAIYIQDTLILDLPGHNHHIKTKLTVVGHFKCESDGLNLQSH